jgi:hypothetical protein
VLQVNMPLLRLLHQISNMYQNVKETQMELKEQQPEAKRETSTKNNKNGSSSSEIIYLFKLYVFLFSTKKI